MHCKTNVILSVIVFVFLLSSCNMQDEKKDYDRPAGSGGWLKGDIHEKFETIAGQFGGFDQTMIEVGFRYNELYFAGKDSNWDYAAYQIDELMSAMENGFQRRPAREASAEHFINDAVPQINDAIASKDPEAFENSFKMLMNSCNACHIAEEVPFINVGIPEHRLAPVYGRIH